MDISYLPSVKKQFEYYKFLGDKTFIQLNNDQFFELPNKNNNSIAIVVKHIAGNMRSRWTEFLTEDGEKEWRNRDSEFINSFTTKEEVIAYWEIGWKTLFDALHTITDENFKTIIYIRNEGHSITEAINRQLCHYSYHIGQIVLLSKLLLGNDWQTLSVAKGASKMYNEEKFNKTKSRKHFTEDL